MASKSQLLEKETHILYFKGKVQENCGLLVVQTVDFP